MLKVRIIDFPKEQYYPEVSIKNQIVLHHTVSDPFSAVGDVNSFLGNQQRIATCEIIGYDGTINKLFQTNMSGAHLGIKEAQLKNRSKITRPVIICSTFIVLLLKLTAGAVWFLAMGNRFTRDQSRWNSKYGKKPIMEGFTMLMAGLYLISLMWLK